MRSHQDSRPQQQRETGTNGAAVDSNRSNGAREYEDAEPGEVEEEEEEEEEEQEEEVVSDGRRETGWWPFEHDRDANEEERDGQGELQDDDVDSGGHGGRRRSLHGRQQNDDRGASQSGEEQPQQQRQTPRRLLTQTVTRANVDHRLFLDLCDACRRGDLERVKHLIEIEDVSVNRRDEWDSTPLYYSSLCGHIEVARYLLTFAGAICDPNAFEGERCIHGALTTEIRNLLQSFKMTKAMDPDSDYALHLNNLFTMASERASDLILTLPNAQRDSEAIPAFHVHRFVLAARSTVLAKELSYRWRHKKSVAVKGYTKSAGAFWDMLSWIYTGNLPTNPAHLEDVRFLANQWKLDALSSHCSQYLNSPVPLRPTRDIAGVRACCLDLVRAIVDRSAPSPPSSSPTTAFSSPLLDASNPDVAVEVGQARFRCHRAVLSRSEYFVRMLASGFQEGDGGKEGSSSVERVVRLQYVNDAKVFAVVLEFLYTDRTPSLSPPLYTHVLDAADFLLLERLKHQAVSHVLNTPVRNVARPDALLRRAWQMNLSRLEQHLTRWFAETLDEHVVEGGQASVEAAVQSGRRAMRRRILAKEEAVQKEAISEPRTESRNGCSTAEVKADSREVTTVVSIQNGDENPSGSGDEDGQEEDDGGDIVDRWLDDELAAAAVSLHDLTSEERSYVFTELVETSAATIVDRQETDTLVFVDDLRWWLGRLHGIDGDEDVGVPRAVGGPFAGMAETVGWEERSRNFLRRMGLVDSVLEVLDIYA
ncbi:hypothetical protein DFJ73DRAFT_848079 [Zopfochytrium polystomum]|nr:hypothetical protein DFJ73DRAFT_848079 [Zopfochytrium polystomum]